MQTCNKFVSWPTNLKIPYTVFFSVLLSVNLTWNKDLLPISSCLSSEDNNCCVPFSVQGASVFSEVAHRRGSPGYSSFQRHRPQQHPLQPRYSQQPGGGESCHGCRHTHQDTGAASGSGCGVCRGWRWKCFLLFDDVDLSWTFAYLNPDVGKSGCRQWIMMMMIIIIMKMMILCPTRVWHGGGGARSEAQRWGETEGGDCPNHPERTSHHSAGRGEDAKKPALTPEVTTLKYSLFNDVFMKTGSSHASGIAHSRLIKIKISFIGESWEQITQIQSTHTYLIKPKVWIFCTILHISDMFFTYFTHFLCKYF